MDGDRFVPVILGGDGKPVICIGLTVFFCIVQVLLFQIKTGLVVDCDGDAGAGEGDGPAIADLAGRYLCLQTKGAGERLIGLKIAVEGQRHMAVLGHIEGADLLLVLRDGAVRDGSAEADAFWQLIGQGPVTVCRDRVGGNGIIVVQLELVSIGQIQIADHGLLIHRDRDAGDHGVQHHGSFFCPEALFLLHGSQRDQAGELRDVHLHGVHLAVHVAGDHGEGVGSLVHVRHDAQRLGDGGALFGAGRVCRGVQRGQDRVAGVRIAFQRQCFDLRFIFRCDSLGDSGVVEHDIAGPDAAEGRCTVRKAKVIGGIGKALFVRHLLIAQGNGVLLRGGDALGVHQVAGGAQVAAQGQHTGALRDGRLRDARVVQAVGKEHHVPAAVGVAVPLAVAGVVADGHAVVGVQFKVFLALLVAQLALRHGEQVFRPQAGKGGVGLGQPFGFVFYIGQRVGQAVHSVVMLLQAAGQHFLIAVVGVVVDGCLDHRAHDYGLRGHRCLKRRHSRVGRVQLLHQLAVFQAAHQFIIGGVAAVVVDVLKLFADQAAVLGVKAVVAMDVLLLETGQSLHFLIAVVGVLMRHIDVLRFGRKQRNAVVFCVHAKALVKRSAVIEGGVPVLGLAFLITADQHFGVAVRRVRVLLLVALVLRGGRNAIAVQLPVHEQRRNHGQHKQQRRVAPQCFPLQTEPFPIISHNVFHCPKTLLI